MCHIVPLMTTPSLLKPSTVLKSSSSIYLRNPNTTTAAYAKLRQYSLKSLYLKHLRTSSSIMPVKKQQKVSAHMTTPNPNNEDDDNHSSHPMKDPDVHVGAAKDDEQDLMHSNHEQT